MITTITNTHYAGRVYHTQRDGCRVITDTLQGTTGEIPGSRTDTYPRAGYPRHGGTEIRPGTLAFHALVLRGGVLRLP